MKPWLVWLALLIFVVPVFGADETTITVNTFPPGQEPSPPVVMILRVTNLPPGVETTWHRIPNIESDAVLRFFDEKGQPVLWFCGNVAGPRTFLLQQAAEGLDPLVRCDFDYGGPNPSPPPPPPGPVEEMTVLVIEDASNRTPEQEDVIRDRAWSKWLEANGHQWRVADKTEMRDEEGNVPTDLVPWMAKAGQLPYAFFIADGKAIWQGAFPGTTKAVLKLIKQYGAEK